MRRILWIALLCAPLASAQEQKIEKDVVIHRTGPVAGDVMFQRGVAGPGVHFFRSGANAIKGAPYAAEAVTERVQVLSDGNRIVEKSSSKQYRDSEGRTRTENVIGPTLAFVPAGGNMPIVFIDDPVGGVHYTLHPDTKTAEKLSVPSNPANTENVEILSRKMTVSATLTAGEPVAGAPAVMVYSHSATGHNAQQVSINKSSLGKRIIEGVEADGTKLVETIPAGAMGNERPIEVTNEVWHSNELKTDVLRKHSDPRFGETTFKLTSIIRGEQPRSLFEPPPDYKVSDAMVRMKKIDKQ